MDKLWAPWRIKYIQKIPKNKKRCIFCEAYKSRDAKKKMRILKTNYSLAILNLFPYNNGHVMVAPKRHTGNFETLTEQEITDAFAMVKKLLEVLKMILKPDGFNIGINIGKNAGAGIADHIHIHIVPRWMEDTNFMPVCSNTKVISQSLDDLYSKIKRNL